MCYLNSGEKKECSGCEACQNICPKKAITMIEDSEGFRYPVIDKNKCVNCNMCLKVCPYHNIKFNSGEHLVFGGYHNDIKTRTESTSGGAFTAIAHAFCDKDYAIFGAVGEKLKVYHSFITDKVELAKFRKSKYSQSIISDSYKKVKKFLGENKKVLFSGTPCQIAGLNKYLEKIDTKNLLTVEVVCEGVPSPQYMEKLEKHLDKKYHGTIDYVDYRYKDYRATRFPHGKWDFQIMKIILKSDNNFREIKKDRWLNPFWNIWLNHLMSRPSCYECPYAKNDRVADITLGDLWGVHLYCPELYGRNNGSSLMISNTDKGKKYLELAKQYMYGHNLKYEEALKYQSPLRKHISMNENREAFMKDLCNENIDYNYLIKKWYQKPTIKLLWSKYVWGNRQKVFIWNLINKGGRKND